MMTLPDNRLSPQGYTVEQPHRRSAVDVAAALGVRREHGLNNGDVIDRRAAHGENVLAEAARVPGWRRLLSQFTDTLILILLAAAVISFVVSGELKTPLIVLFVVVANALIGFIQENRAERSLDALKKMLGSSSRVRREGELRDVPAQELVRGDVVIVEAGDRIPADGRLLYANNLEIEEAALTGESQPVAKTTAAVDVDEASLGDRIGMAYMNTTVTRGRGEFVVTTTGMDTEIGRIAGLLRATETDKTPLQKQLDGLAHSLAKLAGVIVAAVFVIGLLRGGSVSDLANQAVALAVASIPEGLPAVTVVTLALGVSKMAQRNAIVKRLASVETLGCTSVICSDKTGTLTLNQMTAVEMVAGMRRYEVSGEGYSPAGTVRPIGDGLDSVHPIVVPMALCNDAVLRSEPAVSGDGAQWTLVGDPTEGALVALAAKAGIDVAAVRSNHPRIAEVPFDSANKFMVTVHEMAGTSGNQVVHLYVKGAPDVLMARSSTVISADGVAQPLSDVVEQLREHNERLGGGGLRVLAIAERELTPADWHEFVDQGGDPIDLVNNLTLLALVGIVDPPRPEAIIAVREAHAAGIDVKMITGDHAVTAAAIGRELGLAGEFVTGADVDAMSDDELRDRVSDITVFARVAPEHKLRIVAALQQRKQVVAMTGDGVNDAPALKKADMGVAMGITGTEVTKEAATMVLTDDNFATIVKAVQQGRTIYDNIVKFVRFQLSTTLGFAVLFLAAAIFDIANGKPFAAIAILWVNLIMDGPPAMALGVDRAAADVMRRTPRPVDERILTRSRWVAVSLAAVTMAVGTLLVLAYAPGNADDKVSVAGTMAFATFVLFQFFNILNARSDTQTVFSRYTLTNKALWLSLVIVLALQVGVTHWSPLQSLFDTTGISLVQWLICAAVASSVIVVEEIRKAVVRGRSIAATA
jgi:P-type Ca2+ transporter type 2C